LDWKKAQELPVQYPPGHSDANNKEYWEAFRWFAHRNQREFFQKPRHMLETPKEIIKGGRQDGFPPGDLSQRGSSQSSHPPSRQKRSKGR